MNKNSNCFHDYLNTSTTLLLQLSKTYLKLSLEVSINTQKPRFAEFTLIQQLQQ